ncbi:MAG: hypothetical protein ACYC0L_10075 [Thermoleophilia bacterium]
MKFIRGSWPKLMSFGIVITLSIVVIFSMGASGDGGCDSPQVQQPLNEGRTNYEGFLRSIGAMRGFGVPQVWIVAPEDGSTVKGRFEVKGWSAIAADVPGLDQSAQAVVHLYAVPASQYQEGDLSSYTTSGLEIGIPIPVNQTTREWGTDLDETMLPQGEVVLLAVTSISGMTSFPASIRIICPNGKTTPFVPGGHWPAATEKMSLIVVMVKPKNDTDFSQNAVQKLQERINRVKDYFNDVSRGRLEVSSVILTKDGKSFDLTQDDAYYADPTHNYEYEKEILKIEEVKKNIPDTSEYTVIAVQPGNDARNDTPPGQSGHSVAWIDFWNDAYNQRKDLIGSFINIPFDAWPGRPASVMDHEIGHGLGVLRHATPVEGKYSQLPDLYQQTYAKTAKQYPAVDYSNLGKKAKTFLGQGGINPGDYFLMANNAEVSPCGFSQVYLGWLTWNNIKETAGDQTIIVPYLDGLIEPISTVSRVESNEKNQSGSSRNAYYVLEARGKNGHGDWESNIPRTGVLIYKIRETTGNEKTSSDSIYDPLPQGWPRSINYKELLEKNSRWVDIEKGFRFELTSDLAAKNGHEVVQLQYMLPIELYPGLNSNSSQLIGSVIRPSLDNAPVLSESGYNSSGSGAPEQDQKPLSAPDLDLHAYLADGRHIGINYETGEFENPIEGAIVSGDMSMDSEWIMLPEQMAQGVRFEVSSHKTQQFADEFPGMAAGQSLDLNYSIEPAVYNEADDSIYRGDQKEGSLGPGQISSIPMTVNENGIFLNPSEPYWKNPAFILGILAGVLLVPGIGMLAWSIKSIRKK